MKKKLLAILLTVLTLCISAFCFTACDKPSGGEQEGAEELTYVKIEGKEEYAVNGVKDDADGDIVIPSTYKGLPVTSIAESAFADYTALTSLKIPNSVKSIGASAFYCCSRIMEMEIPKSVTSIGEKAFYWCSVLIIYCEATEKPSGWDGDWNFDNLPVVWDCKNNDVADDGNIYTVIDNIHYAIKDGKATTAIQTRNTTTAVIPESITYKGQNYLVTSICDASFWVCDSLISIEIGNNVTSIGTYAFYACRKLTSVVIGNGVESIDRNAFASCDLLSSVTFNDTSTWYRTDNKADWKNKTGGTETDVADFLSYGNYYWYKI